MCAWRKILTEHFAGRKLLVLSVLQFTIVVFSTYFGSIAKQVMVDNPWKPVMIQQPASFGVYI